MNTPKEQQLRDFVTRGIAAQKEVDAIVKAVDRQKSLGSGEKAAPAIVHKRMEKRERTMCGKRLGELFSVGQYWAAQWHQVNCVDCRKKLPRFVNSQCQRKALV
jgi:hypothetical protein